MQILGRLRLRNRSDAAATIQNLFLVHELIFFLQRISDDGDGSDSRNLAFFGKKNTFRELREHISLKVPNVEFDFNLSVDCMQLVKHTPKT